MSKTKISSCIIILLVVLCSLFSVCQAEYKLELKYPPIGGTTPEGGLVNYIGYIYKLGLALVGLAALFALVLGGFLYMSESVTKTEEGKNGFGERWAAYYWPCWLI